MGMADAAAREEALSKAAELAEKRHHTDALAEVTRAPDRESGWDVEDGDVDSGDALSVASAPVAPDGSEELNGWNELEWPGPPGKEIFYRGYWRGGQMHGKGMLKSEAGIYSGDFVTHRIEGSGRYDFADGSVYIGEFKNNFFDGKGVLGYDDLQVYEGFFEEGLRHTPPASRGADGKEVPAGVGCMVFSNGDVYEGAWYRGKRTGPPDDVGNPTLAHGIYVAHNGHEVYEGGFLDSKRHGPGSLWLANSGDEESGGRPSAYTRQAVEYDMGVLIKHRARPSCRPNWPTLKPLAALAKARAQNANWGAGGEEQEHGSRPVTSTSNNSRLKTANTSLSMMTEDEDDEVDDDAFDAMAGGGGGENAAEEDADSNYEDVDGANSRRDSAYSGVDEDGEAKSKKSLIHRVFGSCVPWLNKEEEEEDTLGFAGKPNSIVVVKIEKCVRLTLTARHARTPRTHATHARSRTRARAHTHTHTQVRSFDCDGQQRNEQRVCGDPEQRKALQDAGRKGNRRSNLRRRQVRHGTQH